MIPAILLLLASVYPLANTNTTAKIIRLENREWHTKLADGEALWGLGERFDAWNQRGRVVECWVQDMAQGGPESSYFAVPFVISSGGWGLFVNCAGKVRFDSRGEELRVETPEAGVDVYLFHGTPREILAEYTKLVGRPAMPPSWVFEPWISRNSYLGASEVDHVIDLMETNGLKAGAVVLEAWAEGLQNFKFEERRYPKPKDWIDRLHQRGYHLLLWETPSIWTSASTYPEAKTNGFLVLNGDGSEYVTDWLENGRKIDFRKPAARSWWTKLHEPLVALGVDGFKTDGGERMPDPAFHNLQPFYYQRAVPSLTFARSASPPCAGNSLFWAGDQNADWNSLRRVIRAGLSAAMSGFPFWGHDIGGYTGTPNKKLYLRWLELGVFSPIMQLHGISPREPWYYDEETLNIAKKLFDARNELLPLLLAAAKEASEQGIPIWRPLALEFPEDARAREVDDEFLFGNDLLIAPVLNEFDERRIYLPAGDWVNLTSGEHTIGSTSWLARVEMDEIPVFARSGDYRSLAAVLSPSVQKEVTLDLTGPTNERGVVPLQRVVRGSGWEKIFVTVHNRTEHETNGWVGCAAPPEVALLPPSPQPFTVPGGSEVRLAFYANLAGDALVDSYPIAVRGATGDRELGPATITLVKLPAWEVGNGSDRERVDWRAVKLEAIAADGFIDVGRVLGSDAGKTCLGRARFVSSQARPVTLSAGAGDTFAVWLNGERVIYAPGFRSAERDEVRAKVSLKEGENELILEQFRDLSVPGWYLRVSSDR